MLAITRQSLYLIDDSSKVDLIDLWALILPVHVNSGRKIAIAFDERSEKKNVEVELTQKAHKRSEKIKKFMFYTLPSLQSPSHSD